MGMTWNEIVSAVRVLKPELPGVISALDTENRENRKVLAGFLALNGALASKSASAAGKILGSIRSKILAAERRGAAVGGAVPVELRPVLEATMTALKAAALKAGIKIPLEAE